ncbi:hypothetical protein C8R47DRAFT_1229839 [Mycena vitilis]|nr:hypothetical protein C8R47DRAFT_1229839 [Mycena vitilis]
MASLDPIVSDAMLAQVASLQNEDSITHGVLYETFGPTRDGTVDGYAMFTYKNCGSEFPASPFFRGSLTEYSPQVFGQVLRCEENVQGTTLVLKEPDGLTESQSAAYTGQIEKLRALIRTETALEASLGGNVISTWFGSTDEELEVRCAEQLGVAVLDDKIIEALSKVQLLRTPLLRDRSLEVESGAVVSMWAELSRADRETDGCVCKTYKLYADTLSYLRLPRARESSQHSVDGGSLFAYKMLPGQDDAGYYGIKGSLWNFIGAIFGEVDLVVTAGNEDVVRIKCPTDPLCSVARLYQRQMEALQLILDTERAELGGTVGVSFFDCSELGNGLGPVNNCFYIRGTLAKRISIDFRKRKPVLVKVKIERTDFQDSVDDADPERNYALNIVTFGAYNHVDLPGRGQYYVCDNFGVGHCEFCTA